jgi:predicted RNA-binding Zn-ribbon protein involved in translation (DUF1610 family)
MEPEMTVRMVACASCGAPIAVPDDIDRLTCARCGSDLIIRRGEGFIASKLAAGSGVTLPVTLTRYQGIIDVLIDSGRYSQVYFDHDTELPSPYRGIAFLNRSALQEQPGKGRQLHKKWPDVVGVRGATCDVVVEEEREPTFGKIEVDIEIITKCRYLWVDSRLFPLSQPTLFILVNSPYGVQSSVRDHVGSFKRVVVCAKGEFESMFRQHYLSHQ